MPPQLPVCSSPRLLPGRFDNRLEGGFRRPFAVEKERVICPSANREIIQPGHSIRHAPKRNTADCVTVLQEHREDLPVTLRQRRLDFFRQPRRIGVQFGCEFYSCAHIRGRPPGGARQNIHIQFGDGHLNAQSLEGANGGVHLFRGGTLQPVMMLRSDRRTFRP